MSQGGCYCCDPVSTGMDVDSALHELGMISSVTNSRREYLRERNRTCVKESPSPRFRILRIDPMYVTGFSSSVSTDPGSSYKQDQDSSLQLLTHSQSTSGHSQPTPGLSQPTIGHSQPIGSTEFGTSYRNPEEEAHVRRNMKCRMTRMSRLRAGRYQRFRKPYEVPWRINQSLPETEIRQSENEFSQSKSNSSSPVKALSETSLTRSRSLGNLDLAKLSLNDFLEKKVSTTEREEMERVSSHLENLHVTENS
ncbi:uncharacterized protein LOC134239129 [Saccostrea cucullata]|uniref:uncharacterized protein LOC134239129 n=1 Tax=Saccostrea cuccullata TaxID=36930 RepID=UPI002ED3C417